jgi:calcineurin-like phosphoesterase family protein
VSGWGMTIWFTADWHLFHANVIQYGGRPCADVREMHDMLLARHNERVAHDDTVYVIGDAAFGTGKYVVELLKRFNGRKHLIEGNHDRQNKMSAAARAEIWESVNLALEITVQDPDAWQRRRRITLCHYAWVSWREKQRGAYMLHGHSHGKFHNRVECPHCQKQVFGECARLDVGVDVHNYAPLSYDNVKAIMVARGVS